MPRRPTRIFLPCLGDPQQEGGRENQGTEYRRERDAEVDVGGGRGIEKLRDPGAGSPSLQGQGTVQALVQLVSCS